MRCTCPEALLPATHEGAIKKPRSITAPSDTLEHRTHVSCCPVFQIIEAGRNDRDRLKRTVEHLHAHCLATGQHPPLTAYNALLGAVNEAGSIDHCHLMADILQRTGLQGNDETLKRLYEAYPYNDRIRSNDKPSE